MFAARISTGFGPSRSVATSLLGVNHTVTMRKNIHAERGSVKKAGRVLIFFHSFSSGDAIFEGDWPLSVLPLSPSHRLTAETHSLTHSAVTSIHRPTVFQPNLNALVLLIGCSLIQTTFYATDNSPFCTERRDRLRRIRVL